ncbi:MAG: formylglycine-generating enzyme family protein [Candidatus Electrothrix sp. AR3]|nr:formylglycine-generating enzyme family protein [Candidatus Electrothrix sp. AR3]
MSSQTRAIDTAWHPLANGNPPPWASGWGQDSYGVWLEFTLAGEDKPVTQRMRWISSGQFMMGSPEDEPGRYKYEGLQHQVVIRQGFWLFDTPVTQALWQAVMANNPSKFHTDELRPVEQVSWKDCQQFVEKINEQHPGLDLSLPSEAQWEYACRADSSTALYTGPIEIHNNAATALEPIAWYSKNSGSKTHPVGQKQANDWGIYDMLGNVREWTADPWHDNYQDAPKDGRIWQEEDPEKSDELPRVVRGGSWCDWARDCRSAYREGDGPVFRFDGIGFRCVRVQ